MAHEASFIHTSDLHLNGERSRFTVLARIVSLCLKNKVSALVIAGDLFDENARKVTIKKAFSHLNKLNIPVFLIRGDEDAKIKPSNLPSNVKLIKRRIASFYLADHKIGMFHGRPEELPSKAKFDYLALGHFHDLTKINANTYYSGSPIQSLKYKKKQRYVIMVNFDGKKARPIRIKL